MRSFEQRIAEIHRRSEKIFKERKKRRIRMLITCIPLVLCIGLGSVFILPAMMPSADKDPGVGDGANGASGENWKETGEVDSYGSLTCSVAKIEVTGLGVSQTYTEITDMVQITNLLNSITAQEPESNGTGSAEDKDTAEDTSLFDSITDYEANGYTITLTPQEGSPVAYRLLGSVLENCKTNQKYPLTDRELARLKDTLGIPSN